jgi:hypothetical protein
MTQGTVRPAPPLSRGHASHHLPFHGDRRETRVTGRRRDPSRRSFLSTLTGAAALCMPRPLSGRPRVPSLALSPFLARPTTSSIGVHVRNGEEDADARLEIRESGLGPWTAAGPDRRAPAGAFIDWSVGGLTAGRRYDYRVLVGAPGEALGAVDSGAFTTQRTGEETFTAALMTDAHTGSFPEDSDPVATLDDVVRNVVADRPELLIALGDNVAWYTSRELAQDSDRGARFSYDMYRRHMAPLTRSCPHFGLIGNWEGESGKFPPESQALMAAVRRSHTPNPDHTTYPQGGSEREDYYAFGWGPALFVTLNVQSYSEPSGPLATQLDDVTRLSDWTLGSAQLAWLEGVLSGSDHPYKFVCIHHPVGGNAGNAFETLYGRGGPRAASAGEQATVHAMMRDLGVQIFFFGHDHVFLDEVVDGIHYTLPGSCGAPWKFGTEITGYRSYWPDSGHARLTVGPARTTVELVDREARVIHRFVVEPA